jgi:hypothetical protein
MGDRINISKGCIADASFDVEGINNESGKKIFSAKTKWKERNK